MTNWKSASLGTLPRRTFLAQFGATVGAIALPGCRESNSSTSAAGGAAASPGDVPVAPIDNGATATDAGDAWLALRNAIQGKVFTPADPGYEDARLLYNSRFDHLKPQVVVRCQSAEDAKVALAWSRKHALPLAIRGGGHSYAGWSSSTGLVIDLRSLNTIAFLSGNRVRVGAGCLLMDVYAAVAGQGLLLPGGSGPTVGIAGLALGGGYGLSARQFGLLCDTLVEVEILSAEGELLTCTSQDHADLLWACQGGGGGSFGVVTALTFQAQPVPQHSCWFGIEWSWTDAGAVVAAWQAWAPTAPPALTSLCHLFAGKDHGAAPTVSVVGQCFGTVAEAKALIQPLLAVGTPGSPAVEAKDFLALSLFWADCSVLAKCHPQPQGDLPRGNYLARSDYMTKPLPSAAISAIIQSMEERQKSAPFGAILLDAYGGEIAKRGPDETAFVHRDALFSAQYLAIGKPGASAADEILNHTWLQGLYAQLRPYVSGQVYQNYIDADLKDWQTAYFGANYPKLKQIKGKYDPTNVFRFPQSIEVG